MTLDELKTGQEAEIAHVRTAPVDLERLEALGLVSGTRVKLLRRAPFAGPLLVEEVASGARIMVARDVARHIILKEREHESVAGN